MRTIIYQPQPTKKYKLTMSKWNKDNCNREDLMGTMRISVKYPEDALLEERDVILKFLEKVANSIPCPEWTLRGHFNTHKKCILMTNTFIKEHTNKDKYFFQMTPEFEASVKFGL